MTERTLTFCDKCNPEQHSAACTHGRGVFEGHLDFAATDFGWIERDGQHICGQCLDEEE